MLAHQPALPAQLAPTLHLQPHQLASSVQLGPTTLSQCMPLFVPCVHLANFHLLLVSPPARFVLLEALHLHQRPQLVVCVQLALTV
jgi:hypothetical protein